MLTDENNLSRENNESGSCTKYKTYSCSCRAVRSQIAVRSHVLLYTNNKLMRCNSTPLKPFGENPLGVSVIILSQLKRSILNHNQSYDTSPTRVMPNCARLGEEELAEPWRSCNLPPGCEYLEYWAPRLQKRRWVWQIIGRWVWQITFDLNDY